ncbi:MAG: ThuA domain-containing protein [Clostridia bacterium]|nr:ThuA domain-containing protein [Clostridia bacterium]
MIRVTVWYENMFHPQTQAAVKAMYPLGLPQTIAAFLERDPQVAVRVVTMDQPACGLPDEVLDETDVLLWWSHSGYDLVPDEVARKVADRVLKGMGFIPLHSAHYAKPLRLLLGTSCTLRWREADYERLWCVMPSHPIAAGLPVCIELPEEEMYGEFFDIPQPDELVFTGWFRGGELFRSGCCWYRGMGKVFYFQPGHETHAAYHNPYVQQILLNAVHWAAPTARREQLFFLHDDLGTDELARQGRPVPQY